MNNNRVLSISVAVLAGVLWAGTAHALNVAVTSTANDTSAGSLRAAITAVNAAGGGTITFDPSLAGQTISLNTVDNYWFGPNGLPAISSAITIDGGQLGITIANSGTTPFRLFYVAGGGAVPRLAAGTLSLKNLTLSNGLAQGGNGGNAWGNGGGGGAGLGGAIFNQGSLTLDGVTFTANTALGGNGGNGGLSGNCGGMGGGGGGGIGGNAGIGSNACSGTGGGGFGGNGGNTGSGSGGGSGGGGFSASNPGADVPGSGLDGSVGGGPNGGAGGAHGDPNGNPGTSVSGSNCGAGGGGGAGVAVNVAASGGAGGGGGFGGGGGGGGEAGSMTGSSNGGAGGAGGVGGGGGGGGSASTSGCNGGNGGFGGGGGGGGQCIVSSGGNGGFGGGGGGGNTAAGTGGFGGGRGETGGGYCAGGGGAGLGGAIFNDSGILAATNCTLSGNTAQGGAAGGNDNGTGTVGGSGYGGAIFNNGGAVTILNCTLAANTVTAGVGGTAGSKNGGAVYNYFAGAGITLANSIFANSTGGNDFVNNSGTVTATEPNLVQNTAFTGESVSFITGNPLLASLANNGGPTPTMALLTGSPAINTADSNAAPPQDQRGYYRTVSVDLGAYAYEGSPTQVYPGTPNVTGTASPTTNTQPTWSWTTGGNGNGTFRYKFDDADLTTGATVTTKLTFTPDHPLRDGLYTLYVQETYGDGNWSQTSGSFAITVDATPPTLQSPPTATPNPAFVGQTVSFVAISSGTVTYSWDFNDGTTATGPMPTHVFSAVGSYAVSVTVTDEWGCSATGSVTVNVSGVMTVSGVDSDGNGFSDQIDTAFNVNPDNPASTPMGMAPITQTMTLPVSKLAIKLNKTPGSDAFSLSGLVLVSAGLSLKGQAVIVDVGGVVKGFTLDEKGGTPKGSDNFSLKVKTGKGGTPLQVAAFTVVCQKGNFASVMAAYGLSSAATKGAKATVPVTLIFNGISYQIALAITNSGKMWQMAK